MLLLSNKFMEKSITREWEIKLCSCVYYYYLLYMLISLLMPYKKRTLHKIVVDILFVKYSGSNNNNSKIALEVKRWKWLIFIYQRPYGNVSKSYILILLLLFIRINISVYKLSRLVLRWRNAKIFTLANLFRKIIWLSD